MFWQGPRWLRSSHCAKPTSNAGVGTAEIYKGGPAGSEGAGRSRWCGESSPGVPQGGGGGQSMTPEKRGFRSHRSRCQCGALKKRPWKRLEAETQCTCRSVLPPIRLPRHHACDPPWPLKGSSRPSLLRLHAKPRSDSLRSQNGDEIPRRLFDGGPRREGGSGCQGLEGAGPRS